jgi:N6-adenosine-specific RNA methylase IME4
MKFKTIIADPPYSFRNKRTGGSMSSGSAAKYKSMPMEDLKALPVKEIADPEGCALFLWATVPLLPESLELMKHWGFKFKTSLFWHKVGDGIWLNGLYWRKAGRLGMGFWYAGQIELCMLGIMGKVKPFRCRSRNVIESKARAHSKKPDEIWELVEPYAQEPRIELFCRGEPRPGWYGWGLECTGERDINPFDIKDSGD